MKTKRKEKKMKKRKEKKRKRLCPESISGSSTHRAKALPLGHVAHKARFCRNFIIKTFESY